jgi:hypothetical protein
MQMRSFILKTSLFVLLLGGLLFATDYLFLRSPAANPYPGERARFLHLLNDGQQYEAITIGHSHNMAIDFAALGHEGYHAWTSSMDVYEAYAMLKEILPVQKEIKTIYMPVAYFVSANNKNDDLNRSARVRFYALFPEIQPIENTPAYWLMGMQHRFKNLSSLVTQLFFDQPTDHYSAKDGQRLTYYFNRTDQETLIEYFVPQEFKGHYSMVRDNDRYKTIIKKIEDLSKSNNVKLVLYTPPYHPTYSEMYPDGFVDSLITDVKDFCTNQHIAYYDFHDYRPISHKEGVYFTPTHLNYWGAVEFSELLRDSVY